MNATTSNQTILPTHRVLSACMLMGEPRLEELLSEPIVMLMAKSAGLSMQELRTLCQQVRARITEEVSKP